MRVESFELQSIADAFGSELDGILPDIEGTVAEKLGTAMHNAMAAGVDVENWVFLQLHNGLTLMDFHCGNRPDPLSPS